MKHKRDLIFLIPAVLLGALLCYAGIRALCIYIPQQKEQQAFVSLKNYALEAAATATDGPPSESQTSTGAEDGSAAETEYAYAYRALEVAALCAGVSRPAAVSLHVQLPHERRTLCGRGLPDRLTPL